MYLPCTYLKLFKEISKWKHTWKAKNLLLLLIKTPLWNYPEKNMKNTEFCSPAIPNVALVSLN